MGFIDSSVQICGCPSAPAPSIQHRALNLDWHLVSYMTFHMFQCTGMTQRDGMGREEGGGLERKKKKKKKKKRNKEGRLVSLVSTLFHLFTIILLKMNLVYINLSVVES